MPEPDDELAALRRADPLDPASLPSATDPRARALFERITMTDTSVAPAPPAPPGRSRNPVVLAVAAAVVLLAVIGGAIALTGDGSDPETPAPEDDVATGPITPGGTSSASCVEIYDLETLANRETAFDGTVASVDGDSVTFSVNEWYRGGTSEEVTLEGASTLAGVTSAGPAVGLEPGTRMLVAGDGGFAWSCGFTQPYEESVAEQWGDVFGS